MQLKSRLRAMGFGVMILCGTCACEKSDSKKEPITELEGVWSTACDKSIGLLLNEIKTRTTLTFRSDVGTIVTSQYASDDPNCESPLYTVKKTVAFTIGSNVSTPPDAKKLDMTPSKVVITLHRQATVDEFNTSKQLATGGDGMLLGPLAPPPTGG